MFNFSIKGLLTVEPKGEQVGIKGHALVLLRFIYTLLANFAEHQVTLRAAALTYTTVLSFVPFLAIAFSVLKGLGAQNALEPILLQVAGDSEETVARIVAYVNNTNVKSLGIIGLVSLIITVISLIGSIEQAFNSVWGVRETRSLQRRFSDYLSVVVVGPVLLLAATSMTSMLQSQWLLQWLVKNTYIGDVLLLLFRFLPYVSIWIAMFFLYVFIPNTRIRFASAAVGAVFAGTAWQLVQWGYFHFQVGVANYNAIYGALAAVPIFLVWIYVSWIIVLFGLEIVFAHQHRSHGLLGFGAYSLTVAAYEELALALLIQVNMKFKAGGTPPSAHCLADELNLPLLQVEIVINKLEQLGLLVAVTGKEPGWLPGRDSAEVLISDVLSLLRGDSLLKSEPPSLYVAQEVVRQGWSSSVLTLEKVTVRDLQMKLAIISCTNEDAGNA